MVYEWIVNAYEWICIRLFYIVILHRLQQTLSPSATDKVKQYQLQKLSRQWNKIAVPPSPQNDGKMNRLRIGLVSFPYRSRINPVSFSYRPPIVLLSFSLPEAETIRKQYGSDITWKGEGYVEGTWRICGGRAYTTKITVSARRWLVGDAHTSELFLQKERVSRLKKKSHLCVTKRRALRIMGRS